MNKHKKQTVNTKYYIFVQLWLNTTLSKINSESIAHDELSCTSDIGPRFEQAQETIQIEAAPRKDPDRN